MNINERVKILRKDLLHITQIEFGKRTAISQGHLTAIENGKREVTDKTVKVICSEFKVNEEWLRTGNGNEFRPEKDSLLDQLATEHNLTDREQGIISAFIHLDKQDREDLLRIIDKMAAKVYAAQNPDQLALFEAQTSAETAPEPQDGPLTPEEKAAVLTELNAHDGKKSSPSTGTNTATN